MYQIITYIKFLFSATNQHGVHSPFVFDLVTNCFYDKNQHPFYKKLKQYRKFLYKDNSIISVTDFGAGSRVFKHHKRKVNKIARMAGLTPKRAKLLARINLYFKPKKVLELGTSLGLGTSAMSFGYPKSEITTLEGCPNTLNKAKSLFNTFKINNTTTVNTEFSNYLNNLENNQIFDLIYIDGNHQKKPTLEYFKLLINHVHDNSIMIFDDINWSKEMTEAWEEIKNHPKVSISIDTFFWGFVFFRKENKHQEHFSIRL